MADSDKCCCGHARRNHVQYKGGTNEKGCKWVCTKNGCMQWKYCDLDLSEDEDPNTEGVA